MNRALVLSVLSSLVVACQTVSPPAPAVSAPEADYGISVADEAIVLELEDRREWNEPAATQWLHHSSPRYRARMALALGRIGTATFDDTDGDGVKDDDERMAGVDLLIAALGDQDPDVRAAAAFALGEIGDSHAVGALVASARSDTSPDARSEAVEALSKIEGQAPDGLWAELSSASQPAAVRATALRFLFRTEDDTALGAALDALDSTEVEIRRAASYSLSRKAYEPAREALENAMADDDSLVRAQAVRALQRIGSLESRGAIVTALSDIHPWVRINAIRALAGLGATHPEITSDEQASQDLVALLTATRDPDPGTKAEAIQALGSYADAFSNARTRLEELLGDPEPWFQEQAIAALASSGVNLLNVARNRGLKLALLRGGGATMPLVRQELARDGDPAVRLNAIAAIPDDAADAERALIIEALADEDPVVRSVAIDRADHLSSPGEILDTIRRIEIDERDSSQNDARLSAIAFIAAQDTPDREPWLRSLLGDEDPVVRRIAADLIVSAIGQPRPQYTPLPIHHPAGWYEDIARWESEPHTAIIETVRGEIHLVLLTQDAPITTWNFAQLARSGFFDDTAFVRVVPNFVIQGGDPRGDQTGGPGYAIRDEINRQRYTRGAVGMALSGPDTGGSQFFITHSPQPHLDGGYTVFARVVDGMTHGVDEMRRNDTVRTIRIDPGEVDASEEEILSAQRLALPLTIGEIDEASLLNHVPEYAARKAAYEPDPDVLAAIASLVQPGDSMAIVLGTWCTDSQREVPRMLSILENLRDDYDTDLEINAIAVDRSKVEPKALIDDLDITNVATFIYYRDGGEIGRIVESPRALLEDDLFAIVAAP